MIPKSGRRFSDAFGIAVGLLAIRWLLDIEMRAECRNDRYFGVMRRVEVKGSGHGV
jgi:hypothetical protein